MSFPFLSDSSALLTTWCRVPHRSLWFARAILFDDRVRIVGWTLRGRQCTVIPLENIEIVQWWPVLDDVNFVFRLNDGRTVPLHLFTGAGAWNARLHALLGDRMLAQRSLPDVKPAKTID